jgi:hypothetical protein
VFPLRRSSLPTAAPLAVRHTSLEVRCSAESSYANEVRAYWLPAPAMAFGISASALRCLSSAVHPGGRLGFILPRAFAPPSKSCGLQPALEMLARPRAPSLGFVPSSRRQDWRPPLRGFHPAVTFRPRRVARPRRFSPPIRCGLVSSRCHVQGLPFRGLSLAAEPHRLSPAVALVPLFEAAYGVTRSGFPRPRLQGLAPRDECGAARGFSGLARSAPLLGFLDLAVRFPFKKRDRGPRARSHRAASTSPS